ncbi:MAG: hypothetical protein ACOCVR_03265, partial [Myxococcota bacterium]
FGCPVEIEFAGNLGGPSGPTFSPLQVRPFVSSGRRESVRITDEEISRAFCTTDRALGNGVWSDLRDLIFVRRHSFDRTRTRAIAEEIGVLNQELAAQRRKYVLLGFGRWGSSDPWLGIGVTWSQISEVGVLIEAGLEDFQVDPSQGTHFFQNITSLGVAYLSVPWRAPQSRIEWDWLETRPCKGSSEHVVHLRFDSPLEVRVDGRSGRAVLLHDSDSMA